MVKMLAWLFRVPAVVFATLFLIAGGYFGSSHDFGPFLIAIPILAILLLASLMAAIWAGCIKFERGRALTALALICLTPLIYYCSYGVAQQIRFLLWAPGHYQQLAQSSKKNGVIKGWDSWGMAGQDTFSYLVVDTQDRLASTDRAELWTKEIGQSCGLWQAQRVWPRFYVVTTYTNCPYDGIEPAG